MEIIVIKYNVVINIHMFNDISNSNLQKFEKFNYFFIIIKW